MTKQEFIDYVERYGKEPGTFTSDEIYQLGLMFKSLPAVDKRWSWFIELLGIEDRTPEGVRVGINKRYNRELLHGVPGSFSFNNQQEQLYVAKQKVRDQLNDYRKLIREKSRIDEFRDHLCQEIKKVIPLVYVEHLPPFRSGNEAIALFGDLHIGCETHNYYNDYNYEIAQERVKKWLDNVLSYINNFKIQTLHFCNLGDLINGLIHKTARIENEFDITEQIIKAAEIVANVLHQLGSRVQVIYHSVTDNHSRAVANKDEHIEIENFCKIIDWYVEERLKGDTRVTFAKDNINDGICLFEVKGKKVAMAHGHQDKKTKCLQNFIGLTREYIDYILLGHFHSSNTFNFQNTRMFINGSFVGTDNYAFGMRLFSDPEQKLIIFQNENIVDIDIKL